MRHTNGVRLVHAGVNPSTNRRITTMNAKQRLPILTKANMSNGDFDALAHELSAFVSNIIFEKNLARDVELTRDEIDKLKTEPGNGICRVGTI
ncbi:hypothetical protein CYMTET_51446 [Cymbomonas tetramitiformis]|uniref:Uncharacterized protein n=1 Tax=Cymbomonas tetramitiformis TaxID=36881 RepID=A0AAE0ESC5_9CHLO|nr:hypothetical protein CYMTET_51446 [Cymbomonas tetramitiformis]